MPVDGQQAILLHLCIIGLNGLEEHFLQIGSWVMGLITSQVIPKLHKSQVVFLLLLQFFFVVYSLDIAHILS